MSLFKELKQEIENGLNGQSGSIPFELDRIGGFVEISKNTNYVVAGETGSGKSTLAVDSFIIKPLEWYIANRNQTNIKLIINYFSMERKRYMGSAKMLSRFLFEDRGYLIDIKKLLGRRDVVLTEKELEYIEPYESKFDSFEEILTVYEGAKTPKELYDFIHELGKKHGKVIKTASGELKYVPNHPNQIILNIFDHIGLVAAADNKKTDIDSFSSIVRQARDFYGMSNVIVQQMNRSISTTDRNKGVMTQPKLSDIKDTSGTSEDADVVLAIFDPIRHNIVEGEQDRLGYELAKVRNEKGVKFYRSLWILKNSFDGEGIGVGLAYHPYTGIFKTLPKRDNITERDYEEILSGNFFRAYQGKLKLEETPF